MVTIDEVDCASAERFEAELRRAVRGEGQRLVADLGAVRFLDSSGMRTLVVVDGSLRDVGGELVLAGVQPGVRRALEVAGLLEAFEIEGDQTR